MAGNARTALVGVAFAVLAIAGYQYIYKVGIWKPNISTKAAIDNALARADRVTAAQAKADLDALLTRAEKGERLDRAELERLIKAAATDAGSLDALYKEAESKSRGQIVAPPSAATEPAVLPASQRQSGPSAEPSSVRQTQPQASTSSQSPPRNEPQVPPDQYFFDTPIELKDSHRQWTRVAHPSSLSRFALNVRGNTELIEESKNQMKTVGPRGIEPSLVNMVIPERFVSPTSLLLSLLARTCSDGGCRDVRQFKENPWVVCLNPGEWLELRVNVVVDGVLVYQEPRLTIRPERTESACGGDN